MKYLCAALLLMMSACDPGMPNRKDGLPLTIGKFRDGNVACYTYYQHAISCVVVPAAFPR